MEKRFSFQHSLHASPAADSTPTLIVQAVRPQRLEAVLVLENRGPDPVTYRFLKSQTGSLDLSSNTQSVPTRGSWAAHSGPFTIAKGGRVTHTVADIDQRFALSLNAAAGKVSDLRVSGHAWCDVVVLPGLVGVATAGGGPVDQGDQENFVYDTTKAFPTFPTP